MDQGRVSAPYFMKGFSMDADFLIFQQMVSNNKSENGVFARFYDKPVKTNEIGTNGLPIFKSILYVEIRIKDNNDIFDQPATNEHKQRFPLEFARYQLEAKQIKDGTPLNQFAFLTASQLEACKYHGIFTVEALSMLEDDKAKALGLSAEKELALKFLAVSSNNKAIDEFAKKEKKYQDEIKRLKDEIAKLKVKEQ